MAEQRVQRRLAAILVADIVGYSRLMGVDEIGTLDRLKQLRTEFLNPKTDEHGGRVVKTTGDGTIIEFASVVDAVSHAIDVQRGMSERNEGLPIEQAIQLRIGINVGDIIIDADDIFGDGVNVAARLETLAEPGGIALSDDAYRQVRDRLEVIWEDDGEHDVKNIARPVHVWRWQPTQPEVAAVASVADDTSKRRDKPSIAVLPFDNMSHEADQEYFANGITEDLITDLSKISGLFVAARHSTLTLKERPGDIRYIAHELGVRHILEGSVRRAGSKVRINAQLIDAASGGHLWAERYDGDIEDIFALQDEITGKIVAALKVSLSSGDAADVKRNPTDSVEAYDHLLKGRAAYYRYSPEDLAKAIDHLTAAIRLDPGFAEPYGYLSYCYFMLYVSMWPGADPNLDRAVELAQKAVSLNPNSSVAHARLGWIQGFRRKFDDSFAHFDKAIALDPDNAEAYAAYGEVLNHWGDPKRALELNERAMVIDTIAPPSWDYHIGHSFMLLGRYDEALEKLRLTLERAPRFLPALVRLACTYSELNRVEEAKQTVATIMELAPNLTIGFWDEIAPHRTDEQRERFRNDLRKAGLPE